MGRSIAEGVSRGSGATCRSPRTASFVTVASEAVGRRLRQGRPLFVWPIRSLGETPAALLLVYSIRMRLPASPSLQPQTEEMKLPALGRSFGQGLAGLVAIFDPELVVIGGGLGSIGESIVGPARRVLTDSLHGGKLRVPPVVQVATLGPRAGAVGAALLAIEEAQ